MKFYRTTDFTGHWPVPVAAIVVANNPEDAADMVNEHLKERGLPGDAEAATMLEVNLVIGEVVILSDGNY